MYICKEIFSSTNGFIVNNQRFYLKMDFQLFFCEVFAEVLVKNIEITRFHRDEYD